MCVDSCALPTHPTLIVITRFSQVSQAERCCTGSPAYFGVSGGPLDTGVAPHENTPVLSESIGGSRVDQILTDIVFHSLRPTIRISTAHYTHAAEPHRSRR